MLTVVCSGKASPGCSTAVWTLGLAWQSPVLVADCDVDGGDLSAGFLAGRLETGRGLLSWAAAARGGVPVLQAAELFAEHAAVLPERDSVWLLPGVADATAGRSVTASTWGSLALAFERSRAALDRDVVVDAGRLLADRGAGVLFHTADRVLVAVRPSVRSVHAAAQAVGVLKATLGDMGKVGLLMTGPGDYGPVELAKALGVAVAGRLPDDRKAAELVIDGPAVPWARLARTALLRAGVSTAARLAATDVGTVDAPAEVAP